MEKELESCLLERCSRDILSPSERTILSFALSRDGITQAQLDSFLSDWDIEKAPIFNVMLLAYATARREDLVLPPSVGPRLKGVLQYCRFQNLKKEAHFNRVAKALEEAGIPALILKGGAMKVYRPDFPRWMNDIDFLVPAADYERAIGIAKGLGYGDPMATDHSMDLRIPGSGEALLDIHKQLELCTGKDEFLNEPLFRRAWKQKVFSADGLLPCPEDMVFISLVNLYKNLERRQTQESSVTTFFDIRFLVETTPSFRWEIVRENARLTGTGFQLALASRVVSGFLDNVIPEDLCLPEPGQERAYRNFIDGFLFHRDVLSTARDSFAGTRIGASLKTDYNIFSRTWSLVVKGIKRIVKIPALMRLVLRMRYKNMES